MDAMKKRIYVLIVCAVMLFMMMTLTACADETVPLQERIESLEAENAELLDTLSEQRSENQRIQTLLTNAQRELNAVLAAIEAAEQEAAQQEQEEAAQAAGALAITYAGVPNADMSWPFDYGDLPLGLRVNLDDLNEYDEIEWTSTNESIFRVTPNEDGTRATVTPLTTGSAEVVVTVGERETRSWVRITN